MAPARAEVERHIRAQRLRERSDRLEVGPLAVNRALHIGSRPGTELRLDDALMGLGHEWLLAVQGTMGWQFKLLQDRILSYYQSRHAGNGSKAAAGRIRPRSSRADAPGGGAGRRRTPGLRREELAERAGISVTWCAWIEQGRPVQASPEALGRIARALSLSRAERFYLFELAGRADPEGSARAVRGRAFVPRRRGQGDRASRLRTRPAVERLLHGTARRRGCFTAGSTGTVSATCSICVSRASRPRAHSRLEGPGAAAARRISRRLRPHLSRRGGQDLH